MGDKMRKAEEDVQEQIRGVQKRNPFLALKNE